MIRPVIDARARFERWLSDCGRTRADVARELDAWPSVVTRLADGSRKPGRALAARIETLTGGAVRVADWG